MISIYERLTKIEQENKKAALCLIVNTKGSTPRKQASKMIVYGDGSIFGTIGGGMLEKQVIENALSAIELCAPRHYVHQLEADLNMTCGGIVEVYIEPIAAQNELWIFGAGHVGLKLAVLAEILDFKVKLFDSRKEIVENAAKSGVEVVYTEYANILSTIQSNSNVYVAVMTHSHDFDREIVAKCATLNFAYLGMIGSRRKVKKTQELLVDSGVLTDDEFQKIDSPMGIPIATETPDEIAVSVLAKLIDVRRTAK